MKPLEIHPGTYQYKYLPELSTLIIENHLEPFVREMLHLGYKVNIPLLKHLSQQYSDEQLVAVSIAPQKEFLTYLAENKGYEQIKTGLEKWMRDELEIIGKFQITAKDITLINYVREQALKKWIPVYTGDLQKALAVTSEIDNFMLGAITSATDAYIDLLKNKIEEESYLSNKVIEASPAITFLFDLKEQKEIFVSGKVKEVMGYDPEDIIKLGNNILLQLTHPADLPRLLEHIQYLLKDNKNSTYHFEYRFKHADGSYRWLRTYEVIFKRDEEGRPIELLGKTFEITGEKEIALALAKSEQQLLEAQSIAHIGSYEWNVKENRSTNTAEVFKIFEMEEGEKYEQFMEHVHPADKAKIEQALALAFKTGIYECEFRYVRNGKEKSIWSLGKVAFEEGQPVKMVGTIQDVTEIKQMETELIKKTKELERSNESLQQFASVASHDLKEPLRKINMFTEMVIKSEIGTLSQPSENFLKKTQEASKRMQQMIEDILSFSSLSAADDKRCVSLQTLVDETLDLLEPIINEKKACIQTDHLPVAFVSPSQFKQLFQNLISNSLKFSKQDEPPQIHITHTFLSSNEKNDYSKNSGGQYLQIKVTDNGIGFEEEHAEKIFGLFNRLHSKNKYSGTGLGLTICKRIIENHNGTIKATSQLSAGSTFEILIPNLSC